LKNSPGHGKGLGVVLGGALAFRLGGVLGIVLGGALVSGHGRGLGGALVGGLSGTPLTKNVRLKLNQGIHTSGWNALRLGLVFILINGLLFGGGTYFQHYLLRLFLAHSRALPWRTVPFLEEAKGCILLQRVGGGYRFAHPLLQEYFASLTFSSPQKSSFPQAER
jgi:hypothetical protein